MAASLTIQSLATKPFAGQKPGTSGLRKKVVEVQQIGYLENFVQSVFDVLSPAIRGQTIVVGGDGRFYNDVAIQTILRMAAANEVGRVLVAQHGIFATPAVSATVRARKAFGAIILTASHNPGGADNDFGIKYNMANGGPATEDLTNAMFLKSTTIEAYKIATLPSIDISQLGEHKFGTFTVEVIDAFSDYVPLLQKIFDFSAIQTLLARPNFRAYFDSLNGVTGPFSRRIFHELLGAPLGSCGNSQPLPDFGGLHPDPNLTYAADLVRKMFDEKEKIDFGCAWDGDGDRNMILGHSFFVTPSDSLAIIAHYATVVPHYREGLKALSRSMPTSAAVDRVATALGVPLFEVPTGWKFFGNLMDKYEKEGSEGFICGEESFGTGSAHIREKDGIWATLAWLSILAYKNRDKKDGESLVSVADIVREHWKTYGRNYYGRYDYEAVDATAANAMMANLGVVVNGLASESVLAEGFTIAYADNFEYKDPVDNSVSLNQGYRVVFKDGSRFVVRLSGTGSVGATIRLYLEKYEPTAIALNAHEALAPLTRVALDTIKIKEFIGTEKPTVIT